MGNIFFLIIVFTPIYFLILSIRNIVKIIKAIINKENVEKSTKVKAIVFFLIFICILGVYRYILYQIDKAIAQNM